ncbi:MAG: twin-arginine translocation signal domain-containing protein [bacterium]|nr:twin-arginine translocation signal domain-containing protein [bacterium]
MTEAKNKANRRQFIKRTAAGIAGAAVLPSIMEGQEKKAAGNEKKKYKMIYRTLGKTGIKVPIVSMGVMNASNPNLVKAALDAGIVHLDTAWYYQGGRNEEMVGEVIKDRPRDSYVLGTKVWEPRDYSTGLFPKDAKADTFIAKFETSLKRLGLDYVDILYLHNVARKEAVMFEPYLNAMIKLKKQGKIKHIGVSTHQNEHRVLRAAADSKVYEVVQIAYNSRQKHYKEIDNALEYATKAGLGIVGMKAIAGSVHNIGVKVDINPVAALKWALKNKNIHTGIPGFTTFDQMYADLAIMESPELTPKEITDLEKANKTASLFCQHCGSCLAQCPKKIDIPTLMRSYMYAYGYKNPALAKETIDSIETPLLACKDCAGCSVNCPMDFDIKRKVLDIARLKDVPGDFLV